MAKALRVFIVILLVLSIAALVLGVMLFNQREILKGRTQTLEDYVQKIAATIEPDKDRPDERVSIDKNALMTFERMKGPLSALLAAANLQRDSLVNTRSDLAQTKEELRLTKIELEDTKGKLEVARSRITELEGQVAQQQQKIEEQGTKIAELEQAKSELESKVEQLNTQIGKLEEDLQVKEDEIMSLKNELANIIGGRTRIDADVPRGIKGQVLVVNSEWNFVVVGVKEGEKIIHNLPLIVQRGDQLVGKVFISMIHKQFAVAEIDNKWQQLPIQEGDWVVYNE